MNTPRQQRTTASGRRQGSTTQWLGYCRRDNHGGALGLDNATLIKNIEASRPCTRALCTQQYRTSRSRTGFPWRRRTPRRQKMAGRDPRTTSPSRSRQPSALVGPHAFLIQRTVRASPPRHHLPTSRLYHRPRLLRFRPRPQALSNCAWRMLHQRPPSHPPCSVESRSADATSSTAKLEAALPYPFPPRHPTAPPTSRCAACSPWLLHYWASITTPNRKCSTRLGAHFHSTGCLGMPLVQFCS